MSHFPRPRCRHSFSLAVCAAVISLCASSAGALHAKDAAAANLLNAELPHGTLLETASCSETVFATRQAVKKHPATAAGIMRCAINSRVSPGEDPARQKHATERDGKDVVMPCECLTRIVQAALQAAPPSQIHQLVETAMAMQPQCSNEIAALLKKPGIDFKDSPALASNEPGDGHRSPGGADRGGLPGTNFGEGLVDDPGYGTGGYLPAGFGGGLGTGFPGSPGFIGSAPGGTIASFPPVIVLPVTVVVNP